MATVALWAAQSLTCLEYFARRLIRSVRPDRVRFVQSTDDGVSPNEAPLVALLITGHQATHSLIASFLRFD